jgi:hypothetical protein
MEQCPCLYFLFLTGSFPTRFEELTHSGHKAKKILTFMKFEFLLPYSQVPAMNPVVTLLETHINVIKSHVLFPFRRL